jgi:hypothetical protein
MLKSIRKKEVITHPAFECICDICGRTIAIIDPKGERYFSCEICERHICSLCECRQLVPEIKILCNECFDLGKDYVNMSRLTKKKYRVKITTVFNEWRNEMKRLIIKKRKS